MASSDGSDSDDEMVSCQVCIIRFNQVVKKPKYLDCKILFLCLLAIYSHHKHHFILFFAGHHYFCMSCIHVCKIITFASVKFLI